MNVGYDILVTIYALYYTIMRACLCVCQRVFQRLRTQPVRRSRFL